MGSRTRLYYENLSIIDILELRWKDTIPRFPQDFWSKDSARQITRLVILEKLNLSKKQLCSFNFRKEFKKMKIIGAFEAFNYSAYELVTYCFPELKINAWELSCTPNCFFDNKENVKNAMKWLFDKENMKSKTQICREFSADVLRKNGLKTLCEKYMLYELIQITVPEMGIKEWELKKVFFWNNELIKSAVKWLIEEKLCWEYEEVCKNISSTVFRKNGLSGMLSKGCNNSTINALEIAYPGVYSKDILLGYSKN